LETAQWLIGLGGVDIHAENDYAFRTACRYGYLESAQWLVGLGGVDVHAENDSALLYACQNRHLEVARWLVCVCGVETKVHPWTELCSQTWSLIRDAWVR
jgi:hypothetical protein